MSGSQRRPRAYFTLVLERVSAEIATGKLYETVEHIISRIYARETHRITKLWVSGSYARGAPTCADLDLVVETERQTYRPIGRAALRSFRGAVLGGAKHVQLFQGTPDKNTSGVPFPEARLIWSSDAPDWRAAIAALPLDASAERYQRPTDEIPLEPSQFGSGVSHDHLAKLVILRRKGEIDWVWVPVEQIQVPKDLDVESWIALNLPMVAWAFALHLERCEVGRKTQQIMRYVIAHVALHHRQVEWHFLDYGGRTTYRAGKKVAVSAGQVHLPLHLFSEYPKIVLAPHLSASGPSGLMVLSKGPNFSRATLKWWAKANEHNDPEINAVLRRATALSPEAARSPPTS